MPNMKWFCFVYLFQIVVNVEAFSTRRNWDYRICFHWFHIYNRQMKSSESIKRKWPWCMLRILYCYSTPSFRGKEHLWDWWMTIFLKRKHKCWSKPLLLTLVYKTTLFLYNFQKKVSFYFGCFKWNRIPLHAWNRRGNSLCLASRKEEIWSTSIQNIFSFVQVGKGWKKKEKKNDDTTCFDIQLFTDRGESKAFYLKAKVIEYAPRLHVRNLKFAENEYLAKNDDSFENLRVTIVVLKI